MKYLMKKVILISVLTLFFTDVISQEVEKSIWGVQMGIHPLSGYNEFKVNNSISLRSEIGFGFGWSGGDWAVMPTLIVEPRYYYNLKRRQKLNKQIRNNSGNYLSAALGYTNGKLAISSQGVEVHSTFNIIPMYGLRRNIGNDFNFEFAFGIGYGWTFKDYTSTYYGTSQTFNVKETEGGIAYGLRLSIGYVF